MHRNLHWLLLLAIWGCACLVRALSPAPAWAGSGAVAGKIPSTFAFDGRVDEWAGRPRSYTLFPDGPGAREGAVWVASDQAGIVVAGRVGGPAPLFREGDERTGGDRVDLWVALAKGWPAVPVGWGHQWAEEAFHSEEDCNSKDRILVRRPGAVERCWNWFGQQVAYREDFDRLVARRWSLFPGYAVETYATEAFRRIADRASGPIKALDEELDEEFHRVAGAGLSELAPLEPVGRPEFRSAVRDQGYDFEIRLPWAVMPPSDRLRIESLFLLVEVHAPGNGGQAGARSATAPGPRPERHKTLPEVILAEPRTYRVTGCDLPLKGVDQYDRYGEAAWFLPTNGALVEHIFTIGNGARGYMWEPAGLSPIIKPAVAQSIPLDEGAVVCGPPLTIRRGGDVRRSTLIRFNATRAKEIAPDLHFVMYGPDIRTDNRLGAGTGGGRDFLNIEVFTMGRDASPRRIFGYRDVVASPEPDRAPRLWVSEGWEKISLFMFDDAAGGWERKDWCLDMAGPAYAGCGQVRDVVPPETAIAAQWTSHGLPQ